MRGVGFNWRLNSMKIPSVFALFSILVLSALPALAVNRTLTITAPPMAAAGAPVRVMITAATDATDGEQIGFFHAEYSTDSGKTWKTSYSEKVGRTSTRPVDFVAGEAGTKAIVRVRVAYRGGKAGDVDFAGAPINWEGSWGKWITPPSRIVTINVVAR
jgi:hypothetical protein